MSLEDLEKRIQILEDIEAIKRLKSRYSQVVDKFRPGGVEELVTEDVIFDFGPLGEIKGRKAIADFFQKYPEIRPFSIHYFSQPEITVDGDVAYGRWYMWCPCTSGEGDALWSSGYQDDKYERVKGKWLIAGVKLTSCFRTTFEEGWHKKKSID